MNAHGLQVAGWAWIAGGILLSITGARVESIAAVSLATACWIGSAIVEVIGAAK